jgi:hypothetical protein
MSDPARFHDHARRRLDREIHAGYAALDGSARVAFGALVAHARSCSSLLKIDRSGRSPGVQALVNLARHHAEFRAEIADWPGGDAGVHALVASLARHLLARYPVPAVMHAVWFGADEPGDRAARRWWIAHAGGQPLRAIEGLPLRLTRRMERIFIDSPHHLPLRAALRRAELLGLDAPQDLVDAVLATDLAVDLEHGEFWRGAFHWLIHHWRSLDPARVGPLVDFFYARRIRSVEVMTPGGPTLKPPPDPTFSLAGRTPQSVQRLLAEWHAELAVRRHSGRTWRACGLAGLEFAEPPRDDEDVAAVWRIEELLHSSELRSEGRVLHHCVASYEWRCLRGDASIWSLRRRSGDGPLLSTYTIEVDPRSRRIVQIRGQRNSRVSGLPQRIIAAWAERERLEVTTSA